ncbi:MAG: RNA polymerase sigma factor (sigma-70 family) [Candidatus Paceibacteria bacterium]|jgi:RNA polymerase sigma factor (sigma-70 family)
MSSLDHKSLEQLLSEMGWLEQFARGLTREPELAEEAVQETYLAALQRGPQQRIPLRGWFQMVARNVIRKARRGEGRRRDREQVWAENRDEVVSAPDPEVLFEFRERLALALKELDAPLRETILMRYVEGHSLREIGRLTSSPISTVDTRLRRGLEILREKLDRKRSDHHLRWASCWTGLRWAGVVGFAVAALYTLVQQTRDSDEQALLPTASEESSVLVWELPMEIGLESALQSFDLDRNFYMEVEAE